MSCFKTEASTAALALCSTNTEHTRTLQFVFATVGECVKTKFEFLTNCNVGPVLLHNTSIFVVKDAMSRISISNFTDETLTFQAENQNGTWTTWKFLEYEHYAQPGTKIQCSNIRKTNDDEKMTGTESTNERENKDVKTKDQCTSVTFLNAKEWKKSTTAALTQTAPCVSTYTQDGNLQVPGRNNKNQDRNCMRVTGQ